MMTSLRTTLLAAAFGLPVLTLPPASAWAGGPMERLTARDLKVTIDGNSTLHPWKATALAATLTAQVAGSAQGLAKAVDAGGLKALALTVDVDGLKSSETKGMDRNIHKDLGGDRYPHIAFILTGYRIHGEAAVVKGNLTIHGVSRPVELKGVLKSVGSGLEVSGSAPLRMSDYGVKPPVMMFGAIKVADAITIGYSFELVE